jgi:hypothetical protein
MEPFSADEIRSSRRTASCNESLCEDIDPPREGCPRKFSLGDVQVVFAPVGRIPLSRLEPWPLLARLPCG